MTRFPLIRMRLLIAGLFGIFAFLIVASYLAVGPFTGWAFDFDAYWIAAGRALTGQLIYTAELIGPIAAKGHELYRYPPLLAAALLPLRNLPELTISWLWLGLNATAYLGGLALVRRLAPADRRLGWPLLVLGSALLAPLWLGLVVCAHIVGWSARTSATGRLRYRPGDVTKTTACAPRFLARWSQTVACTRCYSARRLGLDRIDHTLSGHARELAGLSPGCAQHELRRTRLHDQRSTIGLAWP